MRSRDMGIPWDWIWDIVRTLAGIVDLCTEPTIALKCPLELGRLTQICSFQSVTRFIYTYVDNTDNIDIYYRDIIKCKVILKVLYCGSSQQRNTRYCRKINFVAIYALLDVPFSAPAYTLLSWNQFCCAFGCIIFSHSWWWMVISWLWR